MRELRQRARDIAAALEARELHIDRAGYGAGRHLELHRAGGVLRETAGAGDGGNLRIERCEIRRIDISIALGDEFLARARGVEPPF